MKRYLKRILRGAGISLLTYCAIIAGSIVFGTAKLPAGKILKRGLRQHYARVLDSDPV